MERAQAVILGRNRTVTIAEIAARRGINVVRPRCKPQEQPSHSLGTNGLQMNQTRRMSLSDLELQYDQASAELPITQRKYSNIVLTYLIPLINIATYKFYA
jgi:hypothetical protein